MFKLVCDRPPFIRIGEGGARSAECVYCCPVGASERGCICRITDEPCQYIVARPLEDFSSLAARAGEEEQVLSSFNGGGAVWPGRRIYLPRPSFPRGGDGGGHERQL